MDFAELDRDLLYRRTIERAAGLSETRLRRRRIVRRLPAVGLAVVLTVSVVTVAVTHGRTTQPPATVGTTSTTVAPSGPAVKVLVPAAGFVAVDLGLAQIAVPKTYLVEEDRACLYRPPAGVVYVASPLDGYCAPSGRQPPGPALVLNPAGQTSVADASSHVAMTVNGFAVERYDVSRRLTVYEVKQLGVLVSVYDHTPNPIHTLSWSPRAAVLATGAAPVVPPQWTSVSAAGVTLSAPASWLVGGHPVRSADEGPVCEPLFSLPTTGGVPLAAVDSDSGSPYAQVKCPGPSLPTDLGAPNDGLVVNTRPVGSWPGGTKAPCFTIHGLRTCIVSGLAGVDILFAWVTVPGRSSPVLLEIGLAGSGLTARTLLYSLRPES